MTRACGCPTAVIAVDEERHAAWHVAILPLVQGDAATLEAAYGRPSTREWTFVDDQFAVARAKDLVKRAGAA